MRLTISILLLAVLPALGQLSNARLSNARLSNASPYVAPPTAPIILNNLVLDLDASKGLTLDPTGSYVTNWLDQSGNGNNAVQYVTNYAPLKWTGSNGLPALRFYGSVLNKFTNYLTIGSGLSVNSQNTTVYFVSTGPHERGSACLWMFGGWEGFDFLGFGENTTYTDPITMAAPLWRTTTVFPALNPAVFVAENSTTNGVLRWNNEEQTSSAAGSTTLTGGEIGGSTRNEPWGGEIYRVLVYNLPHTPAERQANVNALASFYNLKTNFDNRVVCRGDSTTEGFLITNLMTWPWQCMEAKPNIQWYNYGSGSARIQTNGSSGNVLYGSDGTFVDPLFSASVATNWLFVMAGVNDLNLDTQSGQNVYGRLTNYCAARKAAKSWKIIVSTIANNSSSPVEDANYNAAIRAQYQGYWDGVSDPGNNSPTESRLNDYTDTTYFADQLHLTAAGYTVIRDHFILWLP